MMRWNDEHTWHVPTIFQLYVLQTFAESGAHRQIAHCMYMLSATRAVPFLWHANSAKLQGFFNTHSATTKVAKLHRDNFIKISSENSLVNRLDEIRHAGATSYLDPWWIPLGRSKGRVREGKRDLGADCQKDTENRGPLNSMEFMFNLLIEYIWHTSFNHEPLITLFSTPRARPARHARRLRTCQFRLNVKRTRMTT